MDVLARFRPGHAKNASEGIECRISLEIVEQEKNLEMNLGKYALATAARFALSRSFPDGIFMGRTPFVAINLRKLGFQAFELIRRRARQRLELSLVADLQGKFFEQNIRLHIRRVAFESEPNRVARDSNGDVAALEAVRRGVQLVGRKLTTAFVEIECSGDSSEGGRDSIHIRLRHERRSLFNRLRGFGREMGLATESA